MVSFIVHDRQTEMAITIIHQRRFHACCAAVTEDKIPQAMHNTAAH